jgi:hypothetical protein
MMALPTWAGTLKHYCDLAIGGQSLVAPDWENLPQHTNDHGLYNREVEETLDIIADAVTKNLEKNHQDPSGNLAGELNSASDDYRGALKDRGNRCGGTHAAWNQATLAPNSNWYMPFSMTASPTPRTYPLNNFDKTTANQILNDFMSLKKW